MSPASFALGVLLVVLSITILATTAAAPSPPSTTAPESNITDSGSPVASTTTRSNSIIADDRASSVIAANDGTPASTSFSNSTELPELTDRTTAGSVKVATTTTGASSAPLALRPERLVGLVDGATDSPETASSSLHLLPQDEPAPEQQFAEASTKPQEAASESLAETTTAVPSTTQPPSVKTTATSLLLGKNVIVSAKTRNDLVGNNFHEIGKMNNRNQAGGYNVVGKVVKPNVNPAMGKYTPYFEDGLEELNVTARIGSTVVLDCEIGMLGNKTVTWSYHNADVIRLLTFGRNAYSVDQRICLYFRYPTNWRLKIQYASPRDSGLYECQVATYPPLVKKIHLLVTAPMLVIMDDSGRIKSGERHLKAGSALRLRCEARDVPERYNETVIWTRGDEILSEDVSENKTVEYADGREIQVVVSTIVIERASPRHAGNYSCVVPEKAKTTVAVHVLNGELPAAVHDGNGVSRSVLNLWLIHLTVSYVFSR